MNKILLILSVFCITLGFAQDDVKRNIYFGNQSFVNEEYDDAQEYFELAIEESPLDYKANFNLANTYFRKGQFEEAGNLYSTIAPLGATSIDKAKAYHNLGNSLMMQQKLDEAIEAYEDALRLNSKDESTRYNLAYALLLKSQQEEQEKQENENSESGEDGEEGEEGDSSEESEGNDNGDEENEDEGNSDDEKDDEGNEENQSSENENNEGEEKDSGDSQNKPQISKEQARRILENALKREKEVQKEINKKRKVGSGSSKKKDW